MFRPVGAITPPGTHRPTDNNGTVPNTSPHPEAIASPSKATAPKGHSMSAQGVALGPGDVPV